MFNTVLSLFLLIKMIEISPGFWIKEQSLILDTKEGIVVITGCAHPGVVKITKKTKQI